MLRVLHFSSHNEDCGIAKYQEHYLAAMDKSEGITNEFFEQSPYQTREMTPAEFSTVIKSLEDKLATFDILHIQHEFGFFRGDQFQQLVDTAKKISKKVVVSFHTAPDLIIIKKPLGGFGPRSILAYLRTRRHNNLLAKSHIQPLLSSDKVLVHNRYTADKLVEFGVTQEKTIILPHPTYPITNPPKTATIEKALNKQKDDIVIGCVGYLHRFKGVDKAIKALSFLPANYKLAILGGVKSDSDDQALYDKLADLIVERGLKERVHITGVVPSDDDLNSYIREVDLCVYPYDSRYYKGVSSGALNLAIANERPIVAYPVSTFIETNQELGQLMLTDSDSYYELAREIKHLNIKSQTKKIVAYANANSWDVLSTQLIKIYETL